MQIFLCSRGAGNMVTREGAVFAFRHLAKMVRSVRKIAMEIITDSIQVCMCVCVNIFVVTAR